MTPTAIRQIIASHGTWRQADPSAIPSPGFLPDPDSGTGAFHPAQIEMPSRRWYILACRGEGDLT
jgi:hypothetical protein